MGRDISKFVLTPYFFIALGTLIFFLMLPFNYNERIEVNKYDSRTMGIIDFCDNYQPTTIEDYQYCQEYKGKKQMVSLEYPFVKYIMLSTFFTVVILALFIIFYGIYKIKKSR